MSNEWLANPENQEDLYSISERVITQLAPEEWPIFDEIFPQYVDLALQGPVTIENQATQAFGLYGQSELITLMVMQGLTTIFSMLFINYKCKTLLGLRRKQWEQSLPTSIDEEALGKEIDKKLKQEGCSRLMRQKVVGTLITAVLEHISYQPDIFDVYASCIKELLDRLGKQNPYYKEILNHQAKLRENIDRSRRYDDDKTERLQILEQLNGLTIATLGISFNEFCQ